MATRSDILADDNLFEVRWTRDPSLPFTAPLGAVQVFRTVTPPAAARSSDAGRIEYTERCG
jgi:hypothetical protein